MKPEAYGIALSVILQYGFGTWANNISLQRGDKPRIRPKLGDDLCMILKGRASGPIIKIFRTITDYPLLLLCAICWRCEPELHVACSCLFACLHVCLHTVHVSSKQSLHCKNSQVFLSLLFSILFFLEKNLPFYSFIVFRISLLWIHSPWPRS